MEINMKEEIEESLDYFIDVMSIMDYLDAELLHGARYYLKWKDGRESGFNYMCMYGNDPTRIRKIGFKEGTFGFYKLPEKNRLKYRAKILKLWNKIVDMNRLKEIKRTFRRAKKAELIEMNKYLTKLKEKWEKGSSKLYENWLTKERPKIKIEVKKEVVPKEISLFDRVLG